MLIGMAVGPEFEDLEFWAVYMRMKELGADIKIIGMKSGEVYRSKSGGLSATADMTADRLTAGELSALLIPGGWAPDKLRRDQPLLDLIREMDEAGKIIGFICHAGWVAASAGIMKGRKATGSLGIKDDMLNAGAEWLDKPAFRDGNLIWGRVVADIPDYNRELAAALKV
ncbi:type 1 glutamine amidotransferase domain-containing protein [Spirochaeta dissipatitropha]